MIRFKEHPYATIIFIAIGLVFAFAMLGNLVLFGRAILAQRRNNKRNRKTTQEKIFDSIRKYKGE